MKHSSEEVQLVLSNCCKEVRKTLRSDKRQWLKFETIQDHSDKCDLKEEFGESKQLCRRSPHISKLVSTTGERLKTKEERLERWTEHFKHLLNPTTTSGNSVLSIVEASKSLEIDLGPIWFDEVLNAVRKLKNGKAIGPDEISAEMLKSHNGIAEWLWDIVNKCWTEENLPQDWKLAEVVPLYKSKGKRSECGKYRRISLLSVPGKVFASIILNRCKDALDQVLREERCGFLKSRGCTDQLFALRQILEKCMAFQLDVNFCFIDFLAAFDSMDREMMYKIMKQYGLPQKVVNVICNSYKGFKCSVKAEGEKGQMFDVKTGVCQGDVWSAILFGLVINYVLTISVQGGINIGRCVVLTGNHKGRFGTLIEAENPSRLLIGREVLVGKKKNEGWFETLAGEKLRLKSSAEAELVTVSSDERSVVADLVSMANNRSSAVSDDESCVCSVCKRRFDTGRGCKVHEARFCKSKTSKIVEDSASKFVGLEKRLTCQKCTRKFATVKGRRTHESQYCGREKFGRARIFSCNVHDRDGVEFENVEAFNYLGSFVSLQHGDLMEISVKLAEGRQRFASFQKLWKSKQLSIPLKCKLYRALVLSVVLNSSETWTMNKSTQRKLESFHTSCLQKIQCLSYMERVTNEEVLARARMSILSAMIMIKRLKWFGDVLRMSDDRIPLRAFTWEPTEKYRYFKRAPGGQRKTWLDQLQEDCSRNNLSYITLRQKAKRESKSRNSGRRFCRTAFKLNL